MMTKEEKGTETEKDTVTKSLELEQIIERFGLSELANCNAVWLALLIDTEGSMGWRRRVERHGHINKEYRWTYIYAVPYISLAMKEIESKSTVDKASHLVGVKPLTQVRRDGTKIRHFIVEYGRALAVNHQIKHHLDKFNRMATLLQTLFEHHTHIPKRKFDQITAKLFGKPLTSKQANQLLLGMAREEFDTFIKRAENPQAQ
jgi:hypothetical protein